MQTYDLFDIIGPRMVGPSSSHTAGAARLGRMANKIAGGHVKRAHITLFGSFATTGRGHGTDKAIVAGVPSLIPFDETVMAMRSVGRLMSPDLRETARGGCAATPTGRAIRKKLGLNEIEEE